MSNRTAIWRRTLADDYSGDIERIDIETGAVEVLLSGGDHGVTLRGRRPDVRRARRFWFTDHSKSIMRSAVDIVGIFSARPTAALSRVIFEL